MSVLTWSKQINHSSSEIVFFPVPATTRYTCAYIRKLLIHQDSDITITRIITELIELNTNSYHTIKIHLSLTIIHLMK